ncbi:MAG: hypothetical protein JWN90_670 [Parcubacteria group bacterium]|nr:hypothetical protein [Parcubacteria group bacterium]
MNNYRKYSGHGVRSGYVALMSALILSALLVVLTFAANSDAFIARANLSNSEDHVQAKHFANACGSIALRILAINPSRLSSSVPLQIQLSNDDRCSILSGAVSENTAKSEVRAQNGYAVSLIHIRASRASSTASFIPTYWGELESE